MGKNLMRMISDCLKNGEKQVRSGITRDRDFPGLYDQKVLILIRNSRLLGFLSGLYFLLFKGVLLRVL